jgi:hypothetical protein
MKWQILILTQPSRAAMLAQLTDLFFAQAADMRSVQWIIRQFDSKLTLGENRQKMREEATAEYISFVDDDDLVPRHFMRTILPLLDGVDQIGFKVKYFSDRREQHPCFHSLKYGNWTQTVHGRVVGESGAGFYRDISHLNPMRRTLALQKKMHGGVGEDCRWAADMRGLVKTEHYVDDFLYWYLWRGNKNDAKDALDPWRLNLINQLLR